MYDSYYNCCIDVNSLILLCVLVVVSLSNFFCTSVDAKFLKFIDQTGCYGCICFAWLIVLICAFILVAAFGLII